MICKHCGIQLKVIPRFGGGTWLVAVSQSASICPRNRQHETDGLSRCQTSRTEENREN